MSSPLSGLKVVEASAGIAGPYCGRCLADAGADVVKVEPLAGDPARAWWPGAVPVSRLRP